MSLAPGASVLDAPCGDGFYAAVLARRLGPGGSLTAADRSYALVCRLLDGR